MPTSLDVPMIDSEVLEFPGPSHPYGLEGVGELPIVPTLVAVANAVARATGARPAMLPMSPAQVRAKLLDHPPARPPRLSADQDTGVQ
jgi:CO/xanthine dehydrogenase Mo-binding subunit